MSSNETLPHLNLEVVDGIHGFKLCSFIVAYEGWRRGLTLRWYHDETSECRLSKLNSSTHGKFFSLDDGINKHYFFRSRGDKVANKTVSLVQDKEKTKKILKSKGVSVPVGDEFNINSDKKIISYAKNIGFPVVLKPVAGSMGKGVFVNIQNVDELKKIIHHFREAYSYEKCILEKHYWGDEYRFYVVGNKTISAINRIPANVIGDGQNTIQTLIRNKNEDRKSNPYLATKPIKIDYEVKNMLKKQNLSLAHVPKKGEQIFLRELSNLSAGGDPIDCTDKISNEIKQLAVDALNALPSIPHAGVDIIIDPEDNTKGVVLEINATAEIGFHSFPLKGSVQDVPSAIIDYYFPNTVNQNRSNFYFDYNSILAPLKSLAVDFVEIKSAPLGLMYGMQFEVTGKVQKVGYLTKIKREALSKNIYGYATQQDNDKVIINLYSNNLAKLKNFKKICEKGSKKSIIKKIKVKEIQIDNDKLLKLGFNIFTK